MNTEEIVDTKPKDDEPSKRKPKKLKRIEIPVYIPKDWDV